MERGEFRGKSSWNTLTLAAKVYSDSINSGSGRLNPPDGTYLNAFRINEPVDISYT
ncbi:hypothetical protein [Aquiflexum sp. TKW24L]|uniref:hypothetical protein n=1 Tax=Aquiflexum sp. TKW24L TaxID=2942212 RepID=UPI0020BE4401|nr:hypothetical protein [Aquiflexum sp. TKW24L]